MQMVYRIGMIIRQNKTVLIRDVAARRKEELQCLPEISERYFCVLK